MKATFVNKETKIIAKVANSTGKIEPVSPIVIKNQVREYQINGVGDLPNVSTANGVVDGATLVFNSQTNLYEVKHLSVNDIDGAIDEGTF